MKIDWHGPLLRIHSIRIYAIHQSKIAKTKNFKCIWIDSMMISAVLVLSRIGYLFANLILNWLSSVFRMSDTRCRFLLVIQSESETDETHSSPKILTFGSKMAVFNMQRISASSFIPIWLIWKQSFNYEIISQIGTRRKLFGQETKFTTRLIILPR